MSIYYNGSYYPNATQVANARARDTYTPQQMKIAETIAYQQLPHHLKGRHSKMHVQQNLASTAKALFGNQQQAAPAPAPAPAPSGPSPQQQLADAQLTKESEAYRKEATAAIEAGKLRIQQLEDEDLQRQKAAELQNRLAIQAQTSQARGAAQASLKIAPASQTTQTAGTQAFKRRRDQMRLAPIQTTAGINAPASSVLNV